MARLVSDTRLLAIATRDFEPFPQSGPIIGRANSSDPMGALFGVVGIEISSIELWLGDQSRNTYQLGEPVEFEGIPFRIVVVWHPGDFDSVRTIDDQGELDREVPRDEIEQF